MKLTNLTIAVTTAILLPAIANAKPPEPEPGKRWVLNNAYSDEFNGNSLDKTKWRDKHRTWKGRPPAMFEPATVSVKNGSMQIKNQMMKKPNAKYSIAGGAVQSLNPTAYHGYYESKFKASRLNMSTTFWLSSHKGYPLEGKNHLGQSCDFDNWSMELDIVEAVGGVIDKAFGANFRTGMQYNTHVWYRGCDKKVKGKQRFSKGANVAEGDGTQAFNNKLPKGEEVWQNFNTYAAWWKNENEVKFYLNDGFAGHIDVDTTLMEKPYSQPMQMQLLTETYDWGRPLPTPEQLANDAINTSYYDWVRSYYYAGVNDDVTQELPVEGKPADVFKESVRIKQSHVTLNNLHFSYLYEADEDVNAEITLTKGKTTLFSKKVSLKAGYGHIEDVITQNFAAKFDKTDLVISLYDQAGKKVAANKAYKIKLNAK